jgi:hypothetical protein
MREAFFSNSSRSASNFGESKDSFSQPSAMLPPSRHAVSRSRGVSRGICLLLVPALFGRAPQESRVYQFAVAAEAMKPHVTTFSDDLFGARDAQLLR